MTLNRIFALFGAMVVLATIPSVSVFAVATRSATCGFIHGVFTTIGIVLGDLVFILIAIAGLSLLSETLGSLFFLIKFLGGAYLIILGITLYRSKLTPVETADVEESSLLSSFLTGLFITLGDQKAVLFYLGFFPAFVDLTQISSVEVAIVCAIAVLSVGGVKLIYAFLADRVRSRISSNLRKRVNLAAGTILITVGLFLLVKA